MSNLLEDLAATVPVPRTPAAPSGTFDLPTWLDKHGLLGTHSRLPDGRERYRLDECPFDAGHGKDAAVFVMPSGALAFKCLHNGCSGNGWAALREKYEPGYRDRPAIGNPDAADRVDPQPTAQLTRLSDVQAEHVRWLWPGRIPRGKLSVIDGDPGLGKSTVTLDLAARVTTASPMPDGSRSDPTGSLGVVLLSAEDGLADTIKPRLEAAGADCTRVMALEGYLDGDGKPHGVTLVDIDILRLAIYSVDAALLVVDPLMSYLPGKADSHRDQDIRAVLSPLASLADQTGAAIVVVRHLNKASGGAALYRGSGSIGIIGAARSGLLVAPDPEDETRRILAVTKSNLAAPVPALAYRLEAYPPAMRVRWEGATEHTAASLLAIPDRAEDRSALAEATDLLRDMLQEGPLPASDVQRDARNAGIADATLRRARTAIGVTAKREGFGSAGRWLWTLPDLHRCSPDPIDAQPIGVSTYGKDEHLWTEQPEMNGTVRADVAEEVATWTA